MAPWGLAATVVVNPVTDPAAVDAAQLGDTVRMPGDYTETHGNAGRWITKRLNLIARSNRVDKVRSCPAPATSTALDRTATGDLIQKVKVGFTVQNQKMATGCATMTPIER